MGGTEARGQGVVVMERPRNSSGQRGRAAARGVAATGRGNHGAAAALHAGEDAATRRPAETVANFGRRGGRHGGAAINETLGG
ncbi:hypothetical protein SESBI_51057 [Sesbania bispinosa]|nr:hypothetical protein SESBI_51057 [Sesbania bispinosa]